MRDTPEEHREKYERQVYNDGLALSEFHKNYGLGFEFGFYSLQSISL